MLSTLTRSNSNFRCILLDTILKDETLSQFSKDNYFKYKRSKIDNLPKHYKSSYVDKIMSAFDTEHKISLEKVNNSNVRIFLLKTLLDDYWVDSSNELDLKISKYIKDLKFNNIDTVTNINNIYVKTCNFRHGDLLDNEKDIMKLIVSATESF